MRLARCLPSVCGWFLWHAAALGNPASLSRHCRSIVPASLLRAVFFIEHQSEWKLKPHYMAGGTPGDLKGLKSFWDPVRHGRARARPCKERWLAGKDASFSRAPGAVNAAGNNEAFLPDPPFTPLPPPSQVGLTKKMSAEKLKRQRLSELKNGRLAMIGIVGVLCGGAIPGSVPVPIDWPAGAAFTEPFGTFASYHP